MWWNYFGFFFLSHFSLAEHWRTFWNLNIPVRRMLAENRVHLFDEIFHFAWTSRTIQRSNVVTKSKNRLRREKGAQSLVLNSCVSPLNEAVDFHFTDRIFRRTSSVGVLACSRITLVYQVFSVVTWKIRRQVDSLRARTLLNCYNSSMCLLTYKVIFGAFHAKRYL